jgi:transposase
MALDALLPEHLDPGPGHQHQRPARHPPRQGDLHLSARSCTVRAARLLAEIGDARGRFLTRDFLTFLAGVAPSIRQSGKVKSVPFRWVPTSNCVTPCATSPATPATPVPGPPTSTTRHPPATTPRCPHPDTSRGHVIWRCWQDGTPYDPAAHGAPQAILNQDQPKAARPRG